MGPAMYRHHDRNATATGWRGVGEERFGGGCVPRAVEIGDRVAWRASPGTVRTGTRSTFSRGRLAAERDTLNLPRRKPYLSPCLEPACVPSPRPRAPPPPPSSP